MRRSADDRRIVMNTLALRSFSFALRRFVLRPYRPWKILSSYSYHGRPGRGRRFQGGEARAKRHHPGRAQSTG